MPHRLLSRQEFKDQVLSRLNGRCCVPDCQNPAVDPHHIVERRLWPDGGFYLANGAPLCAEHHFAAEFTVIPAQKLRDFCGISDILLPPQFEDNEAIDKWGNPILPNGTRLRGELFFDEAVQKALKAGGVLQLFTHWVKHPKTWHMPTSPALGNSDRRRADMAPFIGKRVIMTEKRDGECSTLYSDHFHARSLDSRHHPSRDWLKSYWAMIRHDIPDYYRIVGEGLYAQHSIRYHTLECWFEGILVWDDRNRAFSWDDSLEWFALIGADAGMPIKPVPVLYDGIYDEAAIDKAWQNLLDSDAARAAATGEPLQDREGYVIRIADAFAYSDFRNSVTKWVRPGHVQTDQHWMSGPIVANGRRS